MSNEPANTTPPTKGLLSPEELRPLKITYGKGGVVRYSRTDEEDGRHLFANHRIGYYFTDAQVRRMIGGDLVMENLSESGPRAYRINTRPAQPPMFVPASAPERQGLITPAFVCSCHNCSSVLVLLNEPRPVEAAKRLGWRYATNWADEHGYAMIYCPACALPE